MSFKTCIPLRKENIEDVLIVAEDIKQKDSTFNYSLKNASDIKSYEGEKFSKVLVIYSENRDKAYQRGEWFRKKVGVDYYWVK